jgi:hypothetical protein
MAKEERPQILRYPYEALTDITDYLQINLVSRKTRVDGSGIIVSDDKDKGIKNATNFTNLIGNRGNFSLTKDSSPPRGLTSKGLAKSTIKIGDIIILPMPSSIVDTNQVNYSDDSLDAITAAVAGGARGLMDISLFKDDNGPLDLNGALTSAKNTLNKTLNETNLKDVKDLILANLAAQAGSLVGLTNLSLNQVLARSTGEIVNPNMELLFNGPTIRNFSFSFKLTPRNYNEAEQIKLIIRSLKKHMSPKNNDGTFLTSPDVFELRYKQGLQDHSYLNRFKRCALQNMSVNYTGENVYATYDDGAPVSTILSLSFKELEPIYAEDYEKSEGKRGVGY